MPWAPAKLGKSPYFWPLTLGFMLLKYFYVKAPAIELLALGATLIGFLVLYFVSFWQTGNRARLCVLGSCLLGAAWAPHNPGAASFFIFAASMCATLQPARSAYVMIAVVVVCGALSALIASYAPIAFLVYVLMAAPIGLACVADARLRGSRDALVSKQHEVERMATIAERERISRDLHDLLGHTLSLITLKAELARKQFDRAPEAARREIGDIESIARSALAQVRSAVSGYREDALAGSLASARTTLAAAGIALHERIDAVALAPAAEHALALALCEAVTNVVRHAGATSCTVGLKLEGRHAVLRIADNGQALGGRVPAHGNGLKGMRERIGALGGQAAFSAEPGMAVALSIPMERAA